MENIKKFTRNANFGSKELLMRIQLVFLMSIIALCSCGSTTPTNAQVVKAGDLEITKEDLFHHVNILYQSYPEFKSSDILREKNPLYHTFTYVIINRNASDKIDHLKQNNIELYHAYVIATSNNLDSKKYLLEKNPLLYHQARCIGYQDNESLDYLKQNNETIYTYVKAINETLMTQEYIAKLKP